MDASEFTAILDEQAAGDLAAWFREPNMTARDRVLASVVERFLSEPPDQQARLRAAFTNLTYARLMESFAARLMRRAVQEGSPRPLEQALRVLIVHGFVTREAELVLWEIFDVARLRLRIDCGNLLESIRPYAEGRPLRLIESAARGPERKKSLVGSMALRLASIVSSWRRRTRRRSR